MRKISEHISVEEGANVWPHELETARALESAGYTIVFIRKNYEEFAVSADVEIDGVIYEMKSPTSSKIRRVEQNLRIAARQSPNIVFDSRRMKHIPDAAIERELHKYASEIKSIKHLLFINRHSKVIAIK